MEIFRHKTYDMLLFVILCVSQFLVFISLAKIEMLDLLVFEISFLSVFVILFFKKSIFIDGINLLNVFIFFFFSFIILPSLIWLAISNGNLPSNAFPACSMSLLMVMISYVFIVKMPGTNTNFSSLKHSDWLQQDIDFSSGLFGNLMYMFVFCMAVVITAVYLKVLPHIPIFTLVSQLGQDIDLLEMRESSFKNLDVPGFFKYLIQWSRYVFLPCLTSLALLDYLHFKRLSGFFKFWIFFIISLFVIGMSTEKAPVVYFFIVIGLNIYFYKGGRINFSPKVILFIILLLTFPFLVFYFMASASGASNPVSLAIINLFNRIVLVPSRIAMIHFDVFPSKHVFLNGASISGISDLLGVETFPLSNYIFVNYAPAELGFRPNPFGFANASYHSEMWANFGWPGVIISSLLLGALLAKTDIYIKSVPKTSFLVANYSIITATIFSLTSANITTVLVTRGILITVVFLWVHNLLTTRSKWKL